MASDPDRKIVLYEINPETFKQDLADEKLKALIDRGWRVATSCVLRNPQDPDADRFALLLEPPSPSGQVEIPQWAFLALLVFAGAELLQLALEIWAAISAAGV